MSDTVQSDQQAAGALDGVMERPPSDLAPAEPGKPLTTGVDGRDGPVLVSHVAERNHVYGSEIVALFTRVEIRAPLDAFTLRVRIPAGLGIESYHAVDSDLLPLFEAGASPEKLVDADTLLPVLADPVYYVVWMVDEAQVAGDVHEFEIQVRVNSLLQGSSVQSEATAYVGAETVDRETVQIQVRERARYLNYLPALYEQDAYISRFLMLFESFWGPIEQQVDHIHYYLDPELTPARFLPWLASWFRVSLENEEWTEAKQRRLLASIIWLYRKRGTRYALQEYLEILTGHPVEIVEYRAKDFRLGASARLGVGIALGSGNVPHTFGVYVQLDPLVRPGGMDDEAWAKEERRLEDRRRRLIDQLIATEKPAHTSYTIEYEVLAADDVMGNDVAVDG